MGCGPSRVGPDNDDNGSLKSVAEVLQAGDKQEAMRQAFLMIDTDNDGYITKDEVRAAFAHEGFDLDSNELVLLMQRVDADRSDTITLEEFSAIGALKLHLLAQGIAYSRERRLSVAPAKPERGPRFSARVMNIVGRASLRTSRGPAYGAQAGEDANAELKQAIQAWRPPANLAEVARAAKRAKDEAAPSTDAAT